MTQGKKTGVRGVILAAGQGKRMKSNLPKVLHPVLGKTILSRVIAAFSGLNLEHLHIVLGHEAEQITEYLKQNPPAVPYSIHLQKPQLGTGHALMQVAPELGSFAGTLLVSPGDTPLLTTATLSSLLSGHLQENGTVSVLTTLVADPKSYGRIIRDAKGKVTRIVEDKDATDEQRQIKEVNTGVYCLSWPQAANGLSALKNDNRQKEYYLTDLIGWAVEQNHALGSSVASDWREVAGVNSRLELAEATRLLRDRVLERLCLDDGVTIVDLQSTWIAPEVKIGADTIIHPGCIFDGEIEIGSGCEIGPHAVLRGKVKIGAGSKVIQSRITDSLVGAHCFVGPFAHLRDGDCVGDDARIGNFVEIKKSTIGTGSKVSHLSYVGDATIGEDVNIGAGTITANYDSVSKTKSRTVIGDGASTGSNSVLVAPVEIGAQAMIAAGSVITRNVAPGALAVGRARQEIKLGWIENKLRKAQKSQTAPAEKA